MKQLSLALDYRPVTVREYVRERLRDFTWRQRARDAKRARRRRARRG